MTEAAPTLMSYVAPEITENPEMRSAVWQADGWVRETLGRWAGSKFIQWRAAPADGGTAFDLRMTDADHSVSCRFDRFEIGNEKLVTRVVLDAWGKLVDQVVHSVVEDVKRLRDEWRKEDALAAQN